MQVSRNSWHWKFINSFHDRKPTRLLNRGDLNSCNYSCFFLSACIGSFFMAMFLFLGFFVLFVAPIMGLLELAGMPLGPSMSNLAKCSLIIWGMILGGSALVYLVRKLFWLIGFLMKSKESGLWTILKSYFDGKICFKIEMKD